MNKKIYVKPTIKAYDMGAMHIFCGSTDVTSRKKVAISSFMTDENDSNNNGTYNFWD